MRIPPLLTDFIHDRVCKPNCEKMLTLPEKIVTNTIELKCGYIHYGNK